MLTRLLAIAGNTFTETIRQPIYGVVLLGTLILMVLNVGLAGFTLDDDNQLLTELGLSTLLLSGLFLSAFSATSILTRDIESKTVSTVLSKPVGRTLFLAGKYLGLLGALLLAFYVSFLGFIFSIQHEVLQTSADPFHYPVLVFGLGGAVFAAAYAGFRNYWRGKEFMATVLCFGTPLLTIGALATCFLDREWALQAFTKGFPEAAVLWASLLIFCAVMMLASIALAVSTRLGQVMTLLICMSVLMVGLTIDYLLSELAATSRLAAFFYHHLPNFGILWVVDAVNNEQSIPLNYVGMSVGYAFLFTVAALLVGAAMFQRREVG